MANHETQRSSAIAEERKILSEEKKILAEEKTIEKKQTRTQWMLTTLISLLILGGAGGFIYWKSTAGQVYIDKATVMAPLINLGATAPGKLDAIYVNPGDEVAAHMPVARVGTELIKSEVAGMIVATNDTVGQEVAAGAPIVQMIDKTALRVVGSLDEDKGLSNVHVGDRVVFTVDAFGGKQYQAIVDEISPTAAQNDIVFNISDKRQVNQFDIKARFDIALYPELKNGMSARMWVYTN
ncbi:HlyD family efflux transporter periplasmic adaptor subunit [Patescibacteria group bacterium]|nr:HlyD family efflux transporter periplasmic adaptor subunit [Patescibacteria group bacterium]